MAVAALVAVHPPTALGAAADPSSPDPGISFEPYVTTITGAAGTSHDVSIVVKNQTDRAVEFRAEAADAMRSEQDEASLDTQPPGSGERGAGRWLTLPRTSFQLEPNTELSEFIARVVIPPGTPPGGYYAAVVFTALPPDRGQIDVQHAVPVSLFITVNGSYERDLRASLERPGVLLWQGGRRQWHLRIENHGDVHENVSGALRLDGLIAGASAVPIPSRILLPDDVVRMPVEVDVREAPDVLEAELSIERDDADDLVTAAEPTYVVPWWVIVLLAVLVGVVWWRMRRRSMGHDPGYDGQAVE